LWFKWAKLTHPPTQFFFFFFFFFAHSLPPLASQGIFKLNLLQLGAFGCVFETNFHRMMLAYTMGPLLVTCCMYLGYFLYKKRFYHDQVKVEEMYGK